MFSSNDIQFSLRHSRGTASNRKGLGFVSLASLAAFMLVGCQSPQAQEQGKDDKPATTDTTKTDTAKPTAPPKTYKVTTPSAEDFGPQAPKNFVDGYIKAMKAVAVAPPDDSFKVPDHPRVELTTSKGKITVELDPKAAPLNVKSFYYLSGKGFYDGSMFHRQADLTGDGKGNIIQGGDPLTISPATRVYKGLGGPGYNVPLETSDLKHDKLVIAAARSNDPDSAGSQFYITQGATHFLDGQYTVFGKVVEGGDVALKLQQDDKLISAKVLEPKGN